MTEQRFYVFGFGSLIFDPEVPEAVLEMSPAELLGYRRAFNKRSRTRRIARSESFDAFTDAPSMFINDGIYQSLVLGTEAAPAASIAGMLIGYPKRRRVEILAAHDRREGYDASRQPQLNGYLRATRTCVRLEDRLRIEAEVYLTNPDPGCIYRVPPDITAEQRAKVLINGTPRSRRGAEDSRGVHYLEGVRELLRQAGIVDADLEALARAIRALKGPWRELIHPPEKVDR